MVRATVGSCIVENISFMMALAFIILGEITHDSIRRRPTALGDQEAGVEDHFLKFQQQVVITLD
jgi:hypothetical protein